jgi:RNA polymerase sigma factor (sigma-70 family)
VEKTDLQRPLAGIDPNREIALGLRSSNDDTARAALTKLVMDLDPKLHRWLKRTIADENEIADLLQETWKRAWRRRATVDPNRFCDAWAYRICRNVMIDHVFAKARRAEVGSKALDGRSDPAAEDPSSYGDEAQEDTSDLLQRFLDEISKLPEEDQRIVWDWARAKGDEWTRRDRPVWRLLSQISRGWPEQALRATGMARVQDPWPHCFLGWAYSWRWH